MSIDRVRYCGNCPKSKPAEGHDPFYGFLECERGMPCQGYIFMPQDICHQTPAELYPKTYIEEFCDAYQADNW